MHGLEQSGSWEGSVGSACPILGDETGLVPPGSGDEAWAWPLLDLKGRRGIDPLLERERWRGLSPE